MELLIFAVLGYGAWYAYKKARASGLLTSGNANGSTPQPTTGPNVTSKAPPGASPKFDATLNANAQALMTQKLANSSPAELDKIAAALLTAPPPGPFPIAAKTFQDRAAVLRANQRVTNTPMSLPGIVPGVPITPALANVVLMARAKAQAVALASQQKTEQVQALVRSASHPHTASDWASADINTQVVWALYTPGLSDKAKKDWLAHTVGNPFFAPGQLGSLALGWG